MELRNQRPWQTDPNKTYLPLFHEGEVVGFLKPDVANRIIEFLNEDDRLRKALKMACLDLISDSGGDPAQVEQLMKKYVAITARPKHGTGAVAALLRDRQQELDLSVQEFVNFCDSYRLPLPQLKSIYRGKPIENSWLAPLSRILGIPIEKIVAVRDGSDEES